jgi:hypothetical protein
LAFGMVGRFGGSSAGFVVAALNAASAASREVVVLRVLSAGMMMSSCWGPNEGRAFLLECDLGKTPELARMQTLSFLRL